MTQDDRPIPDGHLEIQLHSGHTRRYLFRDMKGWTWDSTDKVLVVKFHEGRVEIPRENIQSLLIIDNSPEHLALLEAWRILNGAPRGVDVPE